jgi:hypothetical protein
MLKHKNIKHKKHKNIMDAGKTVYNSFLREKM